jgi:hypothetical protein
VLQGWDGNGDPEEYYRGEDKGVEGAPARLFIVRNWIEKWRERKN